MANEGVGKSLFQMAQMYVDWWAEEDIFDFLSTLNKPLSKSLTPEAIFEAIGRDRETELQFMAFLKLKGWLK